MWSPAGLALVPARESSSTSPTTQRSLPSLPLPPVPHCWGFPSSRSDVLPAGLLSLLATLSEPHVHALACTHTRLSHMLLVFKGRAVYDEKPIRAHEKNY